MVLTFLSPAAWLLQSFLYQILKAVHHAHMHCVMHRDLKPQNILIAANHQQVKVADFGLARNFLPPFKAYTDKVVTLWYRAPELLLGVTSYSSAIDMWSVGCILAEMLNKEPLFRSDCEIGLLYKVCRTCCCWCLPSPTVICHLAIVFVIYLPPQMYSQL